MGWSTELTEKFTQAMEDLSALSCDVRGLIADHRARERTAERTRTVEDLRGASDAVAAVAAGLDTEGMERADIFGAVFDSPAGQKIDTATMYTLAVEAARRSRAMVIPLSGDTATAEFRAIGEQLARRAADDRVEADDIATVAGDLMRAVKGAVIRAPGVESSEILSEIARDTVGELLSRQAGMTRALEGETEHVARQRVSLAERLYVQVRAVWELAGGRVTSEDLVAALQRRAARSREDHMAVVGYLLLAATRGPVAPSDDDRARVQAVCEAIVRTPAEGER